ncbi:hypothetical protein M9H77_31174 [Catharanthus roseus]|uniref:Uncharacterized protein n=1 Tax=Catharanthus roseus TaxID=4058 RepID=A0ACC0A1Z5_CATRO|nr:hypothetical protein M9H77_31174 [Catharanthus roseus]
MQKHIYTNTIHNNYEHLKYIYTCLYVDKTKNINKTSLSDAIQVATQIEEDNLARSSQKMLHKIIDKGTKLLKIHRVILHSSRVNFLTILKEDNEIKSGSGDQIEIHMSVIIVVNWTSYGVLLK